MPGHDKITPYQPYDFNAANKHYADNHPFPDMVVGARSQTGIITCCDARSSPEHFFELKENEAFVMRNGGGRASDPGVIRTITLVSILAEIKELKIVHHTGKEPVYVSLNSTARYSLAIITVYHVNVHSQTVEASLLTMAGFAR